MGMKSKVTRACAVMAVFFLMGTVAVAGEPVPAQGPAQVRLIPARDLQADLAILKRAYEEIHPGLYRYNTKAEMAAHWEALAAELNRDLTLQEAYTALSVFLAKIRCGHTYANFFNQPEAIAEELFRKLGRVPFYFRWIDRRMIVIQDFSSEKSLPPGTEVVTLDGVPAAAVLDRLMTVARTDGSNDAKKARYLEVRGDGEYEAFDIYFPLFFPQAAGPREGRWTFQVRRPGAAEPATVSVAALTYAQRLAPVKAEVAAMRGKTSEPVWEFRHLDGRTAYLRMPTWALYNSKWDWKAYLDGVFAELERKKTPHLIVDLRENEGGLDVGDAILSRLTRQDLKLEPSERRVRYRQVPADLIPYLDTWDRSFDNWGDDAVEPRDGFYRLTRKSEVVDVIPAAERPFAGRTWVLVGAVNSSATFQFAQTAQRHKLATLVGQPTGGNQRGINGGAFYFLRLPNSKIEVDLPLIGYFPLGDLRPDAGLQPDIPVTPSVDDIARGVDTELEAVLRFIRGGKI